jgi:hypothetical protein
MRKDILTLGIVTVTPHRGAVACLTVTALMFKDPKRDSVAFSTVQEEPSRRPISLSAWRAISGWEITRPPLQKSHPAAPAKMHSSISADTTSRDGSRFVLGVLRGMEKNIPYYESGD